MNKNNYKKGMSLIETIISLAIISVMVVAFMQLFSSASSILNRSMVENQNSMAAQSIYESKKSPSRVISSGEIATVTLGSNTYSIEVDVNEYKNGEVKYQGVVVHGK